MHVEVIYKEVVSGRSDQGADWWASQGKGWSQVPGRVAFHLDHRALGTVMATHQDVPDCRHRNGRICPSCSLYSSSAVQGCPGECECLGTLDSPEGQSQGASGSLRAVQFSSIAQSCLTICDPMDCSMPGLPVHHQIPEFTQTHVHWVSDAIQPFSSCLQSFPALGCFQMS